MIDPNIGGWQSVKKKLREVIGIANKVSNISIQRGGTTDAVITSGDSLIIKLQTLPGAKSAKSANAAAAPPLYAFKVIDQGDGSVSVAAGAVNNVPATELNPSGKPTEIWLKVSFTDDITVSAVRITTTVGTITAETDYRLIASITWADDIPTIIQGMAGNQSVVSCGVNHYWTPNYASTPSYY